MNIFTTIANHPIAAINIIGLVLAFLSQKIRGYIYLALSRAAFILVRRTYLHKSLGDAFIAYLQRNGYKVYRTGGELYGEDPAFIRSEQEVKHILYKDVNSNTQLFYPTAGIFKAWPIIISGSPLIQAKDTVKNFSYIVYTPRWSKKYVALLDAATELKNNKDDEPDLNQFVVKKVSGLGGKASFNLEKNRDLKGESNEKPTVVSETQLADPFSTYIPVRWEKDNIGQLVYHNTMEMMSLNPELESVLEEIKFWLDHQEWYEERGIPWKRGFLFYGAPGTGKCLALGTPVLKYDGTIVPVETIVEGDLLMGPDSKPRHVLSTTRNTGPLFKIKPNRGNDWVCNDVHILTLKHSLTGEIRDIPLDEYLKLNNDKKHYLKQFAVGVEFESKEVLEVDPYFFGLWVGDGTKVPNGYDKLREVSITTKDGEIVHALEKEASRRELYLTVRDKDRCPVYSIVARVGSGYASNSLLNTMRDLWKDTCIPHKYLTASRENRLQLLAGLLDSDGHLSSGGFEFAQKNDRIADNVCMLARSLGFHVSRNDKIVEGIRYNRIFISGDCSIIPTRLERKRAPKREMNKDVLRTGFDVEAIGNGEYAGFTLDGDGRFLLGDFTVTHNTMYARALAEKLNLPLLVFDLASMDSTEFNYAWSQLLPRRIALFEDFDSIFIKRQNIMDSGLDFSTILNALDGADKKQGILTIITTNHPEKLDFALGGSIDGVVEQATNGKWLIIDKDSGKIVDDGGVIGYSTKEEAANALKFNGGKLPSRPGRIDRSVEFVPLDRAGRLKLAIRIMKDEKMAEKMVELGVNDSAAQLQERCFRAAIDMLFNADKKKIVEETTQTPVSA